MSEHRNAAEEERDCRWLGRPRGAERRMGVDRACSLRVLLTDLRSNDHPEPRGFVRGHGGEPRAYVIGKLVSAQVHQLLIRRKNAPGFISWSGDSQDRNRFERATKVVMELLRRRAVHRTHSNRAPHDGTIAFGVWTGQPLKLEKDGPRDRVPVARVPTSNEPARQAASPRGHPWGPLCAYWLEGVGSVSWFPARSPRESQTLAAA